MSDVKVTTKIRNNIIYKYKARTNVEFNRLVHGETNSSAIFLCKDCDNHRCILCGIVLSKTRECRCGKIHGDFYDEHPDFCKECYDDNEDLITKYEENTISI